MLSLKTCLPCHLLLVVVRPLRSALTRVELLFGFALAFLREAAFVDEARGFFSAYASFAFFALCACSAISHPLPDRSPRA